MAHTLTREAARAIEWDCTQLLTRFFNAFDQWRYDDMAAMFAPDGVWHRAGKSLRGGEILEALNVRSRTQTVRRIFWGLGMTGRNVMSLPAASNSGNASAASTARRSL